MSVTYAWNGGDLVQVKAMAKALPPAVVRAKVTVMLMARVMA